MKKYAYFTLVARDKYFDGAVCMYKDWQKLDIKYNAGKSIYSEQREKWDQIDKHVIHFVGGKPWLGGEDGYQELEQIWFEYYHRSCGGL